MTGPNGALILGANYRALGIARSLGRRGIETWAVMVQGDDQIARSSRYVRRTLRAPQGGTDVLAIVERHGLNGWTLFPTDDESAALVAREYEALTASCALTSPRWDVYRHAYHKRLTNLLADRAGVPCPWTRYPLTAGEVAALECTFPVILKPENKPQSNRFTHAKAWRADNRAQLIAGWTEATALVGAEAVMIQELIPGGGEGQFSLAALCRDGEIVASLVARRTRQYPRDFGHSSSMVETVRAPRVEEQGRAIARAAGWDGLVEIEFKHDPRDDTIKLLDINGRVWTWHTLGQRAGVDFPFLAWRQSQGAAVQGAQAAPGVRWIRTATDLPSALGSIRAGELTVGSWLSSLRPPVEPAVLAIDDPLPALVNPPALAWRALRRYVASGAAARSPRRTTRSCQDQSRATANPASDIHRSS